MPSGSLGGGILRQNVSILEPPVRKGLYLPVNPFAFALPRLTLAEMKRGNYVRREGGTEPADCCCN